MAEIKTAFNIGDTVWWAHCTNRVYKGTIEDISCCDYQGALYCHLYSPTFKINPHPTVHYSSVFPTRKEAKEFAEYQKENQYDIYPKCMGCHYAWNRREGGE